MAVTYGFYDSLNHDRLYNAQQMSAIFDGIINDGVFMSVGNQLHTVAGTGMQIIVKSGRAWFDSTWTLNDAEYPLSIDAADVLLTRIDAIVLEVNSEVETRANTIKVVKGTPASTPAKPTLTNTAAVHQHALAYVTVAKNTTAITNSMIEIVVGKTETPYVTAILQTTDITDLYNQWEDYFQTWFDTVRSTLDGDVALNLQNQITSLRREILKNTTPPIIGLSSSATPDDMFQALAHTGDLYVWKKTEVISKPVPEIPPSFELGKAEELQISYRTNSNSDHNSYIKYAQWANEITVNNNGTVSLKNPTVGTDESNFLYGASTDLIGKYFMFTNSTVGMYCNILCPLNTVYYIPNDSESKNTSGTYEYGNISYFTKAQKVIGKAYTPAIPAGLKDTFPVSTLPNAFEEGDNGTPAGYNLGDVITGKFKLGTSGQYPYYSIYYMDQPMVSDSGEVSIPKNNDLTPHVTLGYAGDNNESTYNAKLRGKFISRDGGFGSPFTSKVLYIPPDATFTKESEDGFTFYLDKYQPVTGYPSVEPTVTIMYEGRLGSKTKIQNGYYIGTGTWSSDGTNKTSITFKFPPKLVIVYGYINQKYMPVIFLCNHYVATFMPDSSMYYSVLYLTWNKNTLSWYCNSSSADYQLNAANQTYNYVAIG